jgi:hypothetical protein
MSDENRPTTSGDDKSARLKRFGIAAAALVAVFLLGYVPSCRSARSAESQRAQSEHQLNLARLHGQIGMMSFEANRNNYSKAAAYSTDFFNHLKNTINDTSDAALKEKLQAIAARRDEITANLAQAEPAVKEKLGQMYADFYQIIAPQ